MGGRGAGESERTARRTHGFTESVIREMTRVAAEHDAINLSQGFPDFAAPDLLKEASCSRHSSAMCSSSARLNTWPVGLLGVLNMMARVFVLKAWLSRSRSRLPFARVETNFGFAPQRMASGP